VVDDTLYCQAEQASLNFRALARVETAACCDCEQVHDFVQRRNIAP